MKIKTVLIWFLLIFGFVALTTMMQSADSRMSAEIPIGDFISRVKNSEMQDVVLSGDNIYGTLKNGRERVRTRGEFAKEELVKILVSTNTPFEERVPSVWFGLFISILGWVIPAIIIFMLFGMMMSRVGKGGIGGGVASNKATLFSSNEVQTKFDDVAGCDEAVEEVRDLVSFLKDPRSFTVLGGRIPKGVLLVGPSGTGKTLLARAVAGESGVPFFAVSASSFVEMFVGVGAARVRDLFEGALKKAPCIVFIDELDAIGKKRAGTTFVGGQDEREQTLNELLIKMDGFAPHDGVIVMAATNRPEVLDSALLRAGRFDRQVVVGRPDIKGREAILKVHARKITMGSDVDYTEISRGTAGMTGADLEELLNEAALQAGKKGKKAVERVDIEYARDKILMGPERKGAIMSEKEKRIVSVHESGHAIVGLYVEEPEPLHKITIIPRGKALGLTQQLPLEDKNLHSRTYLLGQITMLLGGRAAEQLVNGDVTNGATNDLERATDIARHMICEAGMMGEGLQLRSYGRRNRGFLDSEEGSRDYSEATSAQVDAAIAKIIADCHTKAMEILTTHKDGLQKLAEELQRRETLDAAAVRQILAAPSFFTGKRETV